jgi:hypothetical protein
MDANYNIKSPSESAAWESGTGRTTSLGNQAQRIGESGNPVYGIYTAGSGTNTDFNVMGANALLQQLGQSKLTKKAEKAFDQAMKEGTKAFPAIPNWPGIRSPEVEDLLLDKSNGILRTKLFDTMGKENFQSMGFPDIPATRKAIMDPLLYETPTNEAGFRIARMDPTGRIVENPLNPSDYPTAMAGEVAGQLDKGVDYKDMFSTHFNNRRLLSQPESGDYYSFSRAHPIQYADQEWLDSIMKAQEKKDKIIKTGKYAKGGLAMGVGGLLKGAAKSMKGMQKVLPQAEREANKAKFLAPSAEKRRMYHGTKDPNITEFRTRKDMADEAGMSDHYADERDAVFLSPDPDFTKNFSIMGYTEEGMAPTTYPVHVQVERPFDFDNPKHLQKVKDTYRDMFHNPESEFYNRHRSTADRSTEIDTFNKRVDDLPSDENNWMRIENPQFQEVLKDLGFDSFYTRERGTKNLGVYDPNRIKSAIGNQGTYELGESDINKAIGGLTKLRKRYA